MLKKQNYHPDKFLKKSPSTNVWEKKQKTKQQQKKKQANEKTKTKDGFAWLLAASV